MSTTELYERYHHAAADYSQAMQHGDPAKVHGARLRFLGLMAQMMALRGAR